MLKVCRYNLLQKANWDSFVDDSKNGTFMLKRDYVEYHSDRFLDFSMMVYDEGTLVSVIPASLHETEVRSHGGLTYGGFIVGNKMTVQLMLNVVNTVLLFLKENGIQSFVYKRVPSIYYSYPSDEDLYALFRVGAELVRRDISVSIYLPDRIAYSERRRRNIKKANKAGLFFAESTDYAGFIKILTEVLMAKHGVVPVHTTDEITRLAHSFPDNIKLFVAMKGESILAGTILYINKNVVHTQYIANSEEGRICGALDYVFDKLINEVYNKKLYFDFGICTENNGLFLNEGLVEQKQEFGGRAIAYDFYKMKI